MTTIDECRNELRIAQGRLRESVEGNHAEGHARIAPNLDSVHEALQWRLANLADVALSCAERGEALGAIILARACFETLAAIAYIDHQIERAVGGADLSEIEAVARRLYLGRKNKVDAEPAVNVLTCVQKLAGRTSSVVEEVFADLCEYSHPNWAGSLGWFAHSEPAADRYSYSNAQVDQYGHEIALVSIWWACYGARVFRDFIEGSMPKLVAKCSGAD